MIRILQSLKVKAGVATAVVFLAGLAVAGVVAFYAMSQISEHAHAERLTASINQALETLKDVRARTNAYANVMSRNPDVIAVTKANDAGALEKVMVREFTALKAVDPTIATLELSDAKGIILMRGHNPSRKGDDKGKLPQIKSALSGQAVSGLTVSPTSGEAAEDSVHPVKADGAVIGTLKIGSYFKSETAAELKKKTGLEVVFVAGNKVTESTFPKGTTVSVSPEQIKAAQDKASVSSDVEVAGTPYTNRFVHLASDAGNGMTVGFFADRTSINAAKSDFIWSLLWKGALAFAIVLPIMLVLVQFATNQLLRLAEAMKRIAGGELETPVPYTKRADEIGVMAQAVEIFQANGFENRRLQAEQQEAQGRAAEQRRAEMVQLANSFESAIGEVIEKVAAASTELEAAAGSLNATADNTLKLSGQLAGASQEASANVQSVASATEELTASVHEIARQVEESSTIARDAVAQAEHTDGQISALSQAAGRIGDVVKLITAIAEQTNLLALNATIEAARAGEAGRGFAVVASEVKALATQTAKATDEIGSQINGMQSATQNAVVAIKEIGATISRISDIASCIASAVQEQGAATQEIARSVTLAAQGTSQVAKSIASVTSAASDTGSASSQVHSSAHELSREGNKLKAQVQNFLATTVRAA